MAKRRIPSTTEARAGIPVVIANARAHLDAADTLAGNGHNGFAVGHLILSIEECEKARTLGKIVLGVTMTDDEVRAGLYQHSARHSGALIKSWSSGGAIIDFIAEGVRESVGLRMPRSDEDRRVEVLARHPEVLPVDWVENAGETREQNLYVDLRESGWTTPSDTAPSVYERLRPATLTLISYVQAAYEREVLAGLGQEQPES